MTNDDLILELLKELRETAKETTSAVNELKIEIVGREKCDTYRQDTGQRIDAIDGRLHKIEEERRILGLTWTTVKNNSVLKAGFLALAVNAFLPFTGRIGEVSEEYGIQEGLLVAVIFVTLIGIVWILMNRAATRKIMGF